MPTGITGPIEGRAIVRDMVCQSGRSHQADPGNEAQQSACGRPLELELEDEPGEHDGDDEVGEKEDQEMTRPLHLLGSLRAEDQAMPDSPDHQGGHHGNDQNAELEGSKGEGHHSSILP